MIKKLLLFFLLASFFYACVPITPHTSIEGGNFKTLQFDDQTYEDSIRTVILDAENNKIVASGMVSIGETPLRLSFDWLGMDYQRFYLKIIHCNWDWTKSMLMETEYMDRVNAIVIENYQLSFHTQVPYYHYQIQLPEVKKTGNYLAVVYRNGDENDIVLSKRYVVYSKNTVVDTRVSTPLGSSSRYSDQRVTAQLNYSNIASVNPEIEIKMVVRQNYRWADAKLFERPSRVRRDNNILEYDYINDINNFDGNNEARFFDARSTRVLGVNTKSIRQREDGKYLLELSSDESRSDNTYLSQFASVRLTNGSYFIESYERDNADSEADYLKVKFTLETLEQPGEVYVVGLFNNWQCDPQSKMTYHPDKNGYEADIWLKQGYYHYYYFYKNAQGKIDPGFFEGNHRETLNTYDCIVYYRPFGSRYDQVVGYETKNSR